MISGYLAENSHIGVKRAKHGIFMFNRNDLFIVRSMNMYGEWCEPGLIILQRILRTADTVVDARAIIGTLAIPFSNSASLGRDKPEFQDPVRSSADST